MSSQDEFKTPEKFRRSIGNSVFSPEKSFEIENFFGKLTPQKHLTSQRNNDTLILDDLNFPEDQEDKSFLKKKIKQLENDLNKSVEIGMYCFQELKKREKEIENSRMFEESNLHDEESRQSMKFFEEIPAILSPCNSPAKKIKKMNIQNAPTILFMKKSVEELENQLQLSCKFGKSLMEKIKILETKLMESQMNFEAMEAEKNRIARDYLANREEKNSLSVELMNCQNKEKIQTEKIDYLELRIEKFENRIAYLSKENQSLKERGKENLEKLENVENDTFIIQKSIQRRKEALEDKYLNVNEELKQTKKLMETKILEKANTLEQQNKRIIELENERIMMLEDKKEIEYAFEELKKKEKEMIAKYEEDKTDTFETLEQITENYEQMKKYRNILKISLHKTQQNEKEKTKQLNEQIAKNKELNEKLKKAQETIRVLDKNNKNNIELEVPLIPRKSTLRIFNFITEYTKQKKTRWGRCNLC